MWLRFQRNYVGWLIQGNYFENSTTVAFSEKLPWFEPTNVISLKTQLHAVNAR